jgi:hypothetical protein
MTTKTTGGPAFPQQVILGTDGVYTVASACLPGVEGMTLRDYFASQALQALIIGSIGKTDPTTTPETVATRWTMGAYEVAKVMLIAREAIK